VHEWRETFGTREGPKLRIAVANLIVPVLFPSVASADVTVKLFNGYGNSPGGEFDVRIMPGSQMSYGFSAGVPLKTRTETSPREFATFCLERNEFIAFNTTFVATIDTAVAMGGFGNGTSLGAGEADPVSPQTAWLYAEYSNGTLSNYDFGDSDGQANTARESDADDLQMLIWWFENEVNPSGWAYTYDNYDPLDQALAQQNLSAQAFEWWQLAVNSGWTDLGSVRVMNLWHPVTGESQQSQLVMMVPAPGALVLACLGIAAAGWYRRRGYA
jgi:hypothetical protein